MDEIIKFIRQWTSRNKHCSMMPVLCTRYFCQIHKILFINQTNLTNFSSTARGIRYNFHFKRSHTDVFGNLVISCPASGNKLFFGIFRCELVKLSFFKEITHFVFLMC
ncbi:hypothetical protein CJ20_111 [Escherichia phage CJ20]|nr:hypothetical protein CJ20_111 [Escherichia phage CJ20]